MPGSNRGAVTVEIEFDHGALVGSGLSWVDVSAYVTGSIRYEWGRDKAVDEFQPGQGSFTLDNRTGIFDPSFTSGTYYGKLKPRRKVRIKAKGPGTAGTLPTAGYVIASGWVEGWPQRPVGRTLVEVDVRFYDFMTLAARLPMPESVYDWQIAQTAPFAWYRLDDPTYTALDSSGHGRHGVWRVYEGLQQPWQGDLMPAPVLKAGETDSVITSTGRPGRSWAAMQAEVGQPLGGVSSGAARTPTMVCHPDTAGLLANDFSFETWIIARQAFPLDVTNRYSTTTPMLQPFVTWGVPDPAGAFGGIRYEFLISTIAFAPFVYAFRVTGSGSGVGYDAMTDGDIHQIVYVYDKDSGGGVPALAVYVDGVLRHNYTMTTLLGATGFDASTRTQAVIGQATGFPTGLQSTLGDVVFWDRKLTATEVLKNYRAGKFGNIDTTGTEALDINEAFVQAFTMTGTDQIVFAGSATGLEIQPGKLAGRSLADYFRQLAASEQGDIYWDPGTIGTFGSVNFRDRNWVLDTQSTASQATLSDASGGTKGYSEVVYRDGSDLLQNDVTVRFVGGDRRATNATSIADYGPVVGSVDTILVDAEQATQVAAFRTWKYGQPPATIIVPERLVIEPTTDGEFFTAARANPGYRITLTRTRPDGSTLTSDYLIDGIAQEIEAASNGLWRTTLTVSPADDPAKPFLIGSSTLGGTDVLWL